MPRHTSAIAAVTVALIASASHGGAPDQGLVDLRNDGRTVLEVENTQRQVHTEIAPGETKQVRLLVYQWLKLGQEAYLYNTAALRQLPKANPFTLTVGPDAKLYVLPHKVQLRDSPPAKQPPGFPIRAIRKVDLT